MPIVTKTIAQEALDHPITTVTNTTVFAGSDGTTGGMVGSDVRTYMLNDTAVAAVTTIAAHSTSIAANTAAISALSSAGGLIGNHQSGTAITNTTAASQLDNYAADAAVAMNSGDRLIYITQFMVVNTSGSSVNMSVLVKINAQNTFQYLSFPYASAATSSYSCSLYMEYVQGSLTPNTNHSQSCVYTIAGPYSTGTITGTPTSLTTTGVAATDYPLAYLTSVADYGVTQPQVEVVTTFSTAATTISVRRISSSLTLLRS